MGNNADTDDDGDDVADSADAFPLDVTESVDTDGDSVGNNADTDDDNDGVLDSNDAYPLVSLGALGDFDGDGRPDDCGELVVSPCWLPGEDSSVSSSGNDYTIRLPSLNDLSLRISNADTEFKVSVDGSFVGQVNRSEDQTLDLSSFITFGSVVNLDLYNYADGYTYTWELTQSGQELALETCGINGQIGCDNNAFVFGLVKSWVLNFDVPREAQVMESDSDDDGDGVEDSSDAFPLDVSETIDTDNDGVGNNADTDDDGDGVEDASDAFPLDASEAVDTDNDGIGNNADTDDDNDGVEDASDALPLDASETLDTDGDGIGNNADTDDDGDGVEDVSDAFPLDATEIVDTDGDGIGNNADNDDDGDGVDDNRDAFPLDSTEYLDTDGDGVGNNTDTDDDGDGVPDTIDALPLDETESVDTDGDGVGNNADTDDDDDGVEDASDAFPLDPNEWFDSDDDGIGNNADTDDDNDGVEDELDAFPSPAETLDTDNDGIGNNADTDDDNDGIVDEDDVYPLDASESVDTDGDGVGNNADTDDDGDGVTDALDTFPLDASESVDTDGDGVGDNADTDDDNDGYTDAEEAASGTDSLDAYSNASWSSNGQVYTLQMDRLPSAQGWIYSGTSSVTEGDVVRLEDGYLRWDTLGAETIAGDVSANYEFFTDEYGDFAVEISLMPMHRLMRHGHALPLKFIRGANSIVRQAHRPRPSHCVKKKRAYRQVVALFHCALMSSMSFVLKVATRQML